jgi:hypothetical protein
MIFQGMLKVAKFVSKTDKKNLPFCANVFSKFEKSSNMALTFFLAQKVHMDNQNILKGANSLY